MFDNLVQKVAAAFSPAEAPRVRILLCAPSNSATDAVCQALIKFGGLVPSELLRLYAFSHDWRRVPQAPADADLRRFCRYSEREGSFDVPPPKELAKFAVVAATCNMASKLAHYGLKRGHFTHIVIDEAGHATEPEAFAVFASLVSDKAPGATQLVLSGDPCQLGPMIRSPAAQQHGLGTSLLERLMGLPLYSRGPQPAAFAGAAGEASSSAALPGSGSSAYDQRCITKLVRNYRSHGALLELPSRLFYDGELRACADPLSTHSMLGWASLPNPTVPLLFHGIDGQDEREANSPSWFNRHEAAKVLEYVKLLGEYRRSRVTDDDIGVITPYRKQVQKIRSLLEKAGRGAIKVGSVEEFQGQGEGARALHKRPPLIADAGSCCSAHVAVVMLHRVSLFRLPRPP